MNRLGWLGAWLLTCGLSGLALAGQKREAFDRDPGWEGCNNRPLQPRTRTVRQDFGHSATRHAGGQTGEIGGYITPAAEPAWFALPLEPRTLRHRLVARGRLAFGGRAGHVLIGFFNSRTLNEWRTPNTVALRLGGRGEGFFAWLEYCTSRWRAGGDHPRGFQHQADSQSAKPRMILFDDAPQTYAWSLEYDPQGNSGTGVVTGTIGDQRAICHLEPGHQQDGATFDRFGLLNVMKSADDGGEVWLDDLEINGQTFDFATDAGWQGLRNRATYESANVRPQFSFGYSPTQYAGGLRGGELGGLVFRGDCREADRLAAYGDRLAPLNLDKPISARGKFALRRGVSDSTVLLGFYHSQESLQVNPSQASGLPRAFLGVAVEGPSREGFFFSPVCRSRAVQAAAGYASAPRVVPDGISHDWSLDYRPGGSGGAIVVTLDDQRVVLELPADVRRERVAFDRFGIVTTWVDGNAQEVFFDDLEYTHRQD